MSDVVAVSCLLYSYTVCSGTMTCSTLGNSCGGFYQNDLSICWSKYIPLLGLLLPAIGKSVSSLSDLTSQQ